MQLVVRQIGQATFIFLKFILQKCNKKEILITPNFSKSVSVSKLHQFFVILKKMEKLDIAINI